MKIIYGTAKTLHYLAAAGLLVLMVLQVANMIGRYFFNSPIQGTTDLGSYMLLIITALGLGWAALERRHISVGLVMDLFPSRVQLVTDTIILTMICAVSAFVSYLNILRRDHLAATLFVCAEPPVRAVSIRPGRWVRGTCGLHVDDNSRELQAYRRHRGRPL